MRIEILKMHLIVWQGCIFGTVALRSGALEFRLGVRKTKAFAPPLPLHL